MNRSTALRTGLLLATVVVFLPPSALAGDPAGDVNFFLGEKFLDDEDWSPMEDQGAFGVEMSWGNTDWPVRVATDVFWSADIKNDPFEDVIALTAELDVGVRKIWELERTRPYVGAGMGIISGYVNEDFTFFEEDDWDSTIGPWVNAGIFWRLGGRFNIGLSVRWSRAEVELFGEEVQAGGFQYGLVLGFGWPGYAD